MLTVQNLDHVYKSGKFRLTVPTAKFDAQGITAVVGPNGSGKSTLLSFLSGLARPRQGVVRYGTKDCFSSFEAIKRDIQLLSWDVQLYDEATGAEHIQLLRRLFKGWDQQLETELAQEFNLPIDQPVEKLSRGENVKLKLILTMCRKPKVILVDEILNDLDTESRRAVYKRLDRYSFENESLVFVATNILTDVERYANEIVLLSKGVLRLKENLDSLKERHRRLALRRSTSATPGNPSVVHHRWIEWDGSSGTLVTDDYTDSVEATLRDLGIESSPVPHPLEDILSIYGDI